MTGAVNATLGPAIITALRGDVTVAAEVAARVYAYAPDDRLYPFVTLGDIFSQPWDTCGVEGNEATVSIHVWTRGTDVRSVGETIGDAIRSALHRHPETLAVAGHAVVSCRLLNSVFRPEKVEGSTSIGQLILRFRIITQQD